VEVNPFIVVATLITHVKKIVRYTTAHKKTWLSNKETKMCGNNNEYYKITIINCNL